MKEKQKNGELQTRREFFKKAAKSVLPIVAGVVVAGMPQVVKAMEKAPMGCQGYSCQGGCQFSCSQVCNSSCQGSCKNDCYRSCYNGCNTTCKDSCDRTCKGYCVNTCRGGCYGSCKNTSR